MSEKKIVKLSGCTPKKGTSIYGVSNAFCKLGFKRKVFKTNKKNKALSFLKKIKYPTIFLVMNGDHYVVSLYVASDSIAIVDSSRVDYNMKENGLRTMSIDKFMKCWYFKKMKVYSAIVVYK